MLLEARNKPSNAGFVGECTDIGHRVHIERGIVRDSRDDNGEGGCPKPCRAPPQNHKSPASPHLAAQSRNFSTESRLVRQSARDPSTHTICIPHQSAESESAESI